MKRLTLNVSLFLFKNVLQIETKEKSKEPQEKQKVASK